MIQAIINATNNNWMGFPVLFALCSVASIVIWFVDVEKGRENCRVYVEERKLVRVAKEAGLTRDEIIQGVTTGGLAAENGSSDGVEIPGVGAGTTGKDIAM